MTSHGASSTDIAAAMSDLAVQTASSESSSPRGGDGQPAADGGRPASQGTGSLRKAPHQLNARPTLCDASNSCKGCPHGCPIPHVYCAQVATLKAARASHTSAATDAGTEIDKTYFKKWPFC